MIQVKTLDGYKLPDNIFYKNYETFVQVKKVFSNQRLLERTTICSCEMGTSQLIKSIKSIIVTYKDLTKYITGEELTSTLNTIKELENEIESLKIDQVIYNQQLTIIDNDRHLRTELIPAVYGLNLITEKVISNTPTAQIVVKIVVGNNTFNPDLVYSPLPANMFKYDGDYYYIGNQSDQETILDTITNKFGNGKVALQVYSSNEIITILRLIVKERVENNISQLKKIITQQDIIDSLIIDRKNKVNLDSTLESINTDIAVKDFYEVNSITEVDNNNLTSMSIRTNTQLRLDNLMPGTRIDIKTPLFPFTIDALNLKTDELLGYTNIVRIVDVSGVLSPNEWTQIYNSSDVHEFKFNKMGRLNTGVHFDQIEGTLLQTLQHSRISSNINLGILKDLSTMKLAKLTREPMAVSNIVSELSDKLDDIIESVKLGTFPSHIVSLSTAGVMNIDANIRFSNAEGRYHIVTDSDSRVFNMSDSVKLGSGVSYDVNFVPASLPTTYTTWLQNSTLTNIGTVDNPILNMVGQFSEAKWKLNNQGVSGKVYFEVENLGTEGLYGPTLSLSDGGAGRVYIIDNSVWGRRRGITIDLDSRQAYVDGILVATYGRQGDYYLTVLDGTSYSNEKVAVYFTKDACMLPKPSDAKYWGASLIETIVETDSHSRIITNTSSPILTITPKVSITGFNAEIVSESSNVIEVLPEIVQPTAQTKYIISPVSTVINPITENIKTGAGISYKNSVLTENDSHTKIISNMSDVPVTIQEFDVVTTQAHTRVVSLIGSNIYTIEDVIATATAHPQLSTPSSDVINLMSDRKVKLTSSIIPIITNTDSPINSVVENVKVVNDPIPFTVYQQSVGEVKQFDKPIMEPSSIDIYVSSVKNIGAMSRIDPITVIVDKVPNYISTQTNMSDVLTYSDTVTAVKTINNYVVSQLETGTPTVIIPTMKSEGTEIYVTESKSMNTATFGDIIDVLMLPSDSYIVSKVSNNTATFGDVLDCINTPHDSDAIIDVKSVKSVTFDNSVLELSTDSVDKVIDIKSIKTITFDNSVLELSTDRMDKVIDIKAVKPITFSNNVDMTLNSEGSAFIISNGLVYSASDENGVLVVADTVDGKHYAIVRDETGILESYETDLPITSNNYFYDSVANVMYKVTSTSGFIDLVAM